VTTPEKQDALKAGIAALKAGRRDEGRQLLMEAVEQDEENEMAWLWLSGAVDTDEDKRICLENVLTLNPDNQAAKRGLAKLGDTAVSPPQIIRREITPPNLAGAILYPERHTQEWEWRDPTPDRHVPTTGIAQKSSYDDVWERDDDICAFCAQELAEEDKTCPRCGRQLQTVTYRYENPSVNLVNFWVTLITIGQSYFIQTFYNVIVTQQVSSAILPIILTAVFFVLVAGVYLRQYWAYISAIFLLIILLTINIVGIFIPADPSSAAVIRAAPIIDTIVIPATNIVGAALRGFQMLAFIVALIVAVLKVGPDFDRVKTRHVAKLKKGLQSPGSYHSEARRAAKRGEWATAVLHWQRAAANAPANRQFQRQLGIAYARLGFYQRSADVLRSALRITPDPEQQAQINRLLTTVQKHLNTENE
jgi:hypothetical protein